MTEDAFGGAGPAAATDQFNALAFMLEQRIKDLAGPTLVQVINCTNDGDDSAQGTVTVQPLVNQMTGKRVAVPHGQLFNLPYSRVSAGPCAVIMDPVEGDIGLACFASRDISTVKKTQAQANPGSYRIWDWSDGIYLFTVLSKTQPTRFIRFAAGGLFVVDTTEISLMVGTKGIVINSGGTTIDGKLFLPHEHTPGAYEAGGDPVTNNSGGVV